MIEKTRIRWDDEQKSNLAWATSELLIESGEGSLFYSYSLMKHFRTALAKILPEEQQRYIKGPSQVPWLEPMVRDFINRRELSEDEDEETETAAEMLLDSIIDFEEKVLAVLDQQTENISNLIKVVENLARMIKPADPLPVNLPTITVEQPKVRILMVGLYRGKQHTKIHKFALNYPNIKLIDFEPTHSHQDVPNHDHVLVMTWVSRHCSQRLRNMIGGEFNIANGVEETERFITQFAGKK